MSKLRVSQIQHPNSEEPNVTLLPDGTIDISEVSINTSNLSYDNTASGLTATNLQSAIDEIKTNVDSIPSDAESVTYNNTTSGLSSTNIQGAVDETFGFLSNRNTIINGNFNINQRNVSATVTLSAGQYGHDRWKAGSGGCTYTFSTSNNITTITITSGTLQQVIEGLNLMSGTYVLSWTGTAQASIDGSSFGNSGITGTAVGGTNQTIEFSLGTVSMVQYESGSVPTSFERRPHGVELSLCQRYFQKLMWNTAMGISGGNGGSGYSTYIGWNFPFPVVMRASPTIDTSNINIMEPGASTKTYGSDGTSFGINIGQTSNNYEYILNGSYALFSAEL
ncbi:MAG: hypothetical protein WDZ42_01220 [Candidatus Saccharimonadales bacterium]